MSYTVEIYCVFYLMIDKIIFSETSSTKEIEWLVGIKILQGKKTNEQVVQ